MTLTVPVTGVAVRGLVCDLDGVVYRGPEAVPGVIDALRRWVRGGGHVVYATNNASRTPEVVAEHLRGLGLDTEDNEVLTSAQVGARVLAERLQRGSVVLAVGGPGVAAALVEVGLTPTFVSAPDVVGVLQGYGPDVRARDLNEAAHAVASGAVWVATNSDRSIPTGRGIGPGNGMYVAAVSEATGVVPPFVGKPEPAMAQMAADRMGLPVTACLAVGDRLDTDIAGGARAGMATLFVLSGVHTISSLARYEDIIPTFVSWDLGSLGRVALRPVDDVRRTAESTWELGATSITRGRPDGWVVDAPPGLEGDHEALTCAAAAVCALRDDGSLTTHHNDGAAGPGWGLEELDDLLSDRTRATGPS